MRSTNTPVPSIYGELSPEAAEAYSKWMDALLERADHTLTCRDGCDLTRYGCEVGWALDDGQYQRWQEWHAARMADLEGAS